MPLDLDDLMTCLNGMTPQQTAILATIIGPAVATPVQSALAALRSGATTWHQYCNFLQWCEDNAVPTRDRHEKFTTAVSAIEDAVDRTEITAHQLHHAKLTLRYGESVGTAAYRELSLSAVHSDLDDRSASHIDIMKWVKAHQDTTRGPQRPNVQGRARRGRRTGRARTSDQAPPGRLAPRVLPLGPPPGAAPSRGRA